MQQPITQLSGTGGDLTEALRHLSASKSSGWMYVGNASWTATLFFEAGRVRAATFGSSEDLEALAKLARVWPSGEFVFETGRAAPVRRTIDLNLTEMLRLLDPAAPTLGADGPDQSLHAVPRVLVPINGFFDGGEVQLSRAMVQTLNAVDGTRTAAAIVALRGTRTAMAHLSTLADMGIIGFTTGTPLTPLALPGEDPAPIDMPGGLQVACPRLGSYDDPSTRLDRPSSVHSCFATGRPVALALMQQRDVCLTASHRTCPLLAAASPMTHIDSGKPSTTLPTVDEARQIDDVGSAKTGRSPFRLAASGRLQVGAILGIVVLAVATAIVFSLRASSHASVGTAVTPIATVVPTAMPTVASIEPTAAPVPVLLPVAPLVSPRTVLRETFADNSRVWPNDPQGPAWLASGAYYLAPRKPGQFVAIGVPLGDVLGDVTVRASFRKVAGPPGGGYGIIVRDQGPGPRDGLNQNGRYYVLEVGDKGQVGIWQRDSDHWTEILPWTNSDAVRSANGTNQVEVRASGDRFTLAVNGTDVSTQSNGALAFGSVGLFVGGDQNQVQVQDLTILAPRS